MEHRKQPLLREEDPTAELQDTGVGLQVCASLAQEGTSPLSESLPIPVGARGLYIKTYGCQMNVYDSQRMEEALQPLGFAIVDVPENADVAILNGCQIREKSEEKLFSDLGRLKTARQKRQKQGHGLIIVVAGCVGQALGAQVLKRAPYVDAVVGPQTYHSLPETITRLLRQLEPEKAHLALGFPKMEKFDELPQARAIKGPSAFLSIQEGCDKFCGYCVVPYTRGPEYSRAVQHVLDEARALVDQGATELTLLGQNVNAYHGRDDQGGECGLGQLLEILATRLPAVRRLRYTTSHPRDVDEALIAAHRDIPAVMPFLHLPVQSGSDRVLARMKRRYTAVFYRDIIDRFRKARPDMAFSSDFIVGYPGETDEDFQATLDLVDQVGFAQAFSFQYSPRKGTPAAMAVQIEEAIKQDRLAQLQERLHAQRVAYNQTFVGRCIEVMIEPPLAKAIAASSRDVAGGRRLVSHQSVQKQKGPWPGEAVVQGFRGEGFGLQESGGSDTDVILQGGAGGGSGAQTLDLFGNAVRSQEGAARIQGDPQNTFLDPLTAVHPLRLMGRSPYLQAVHVDVVSGGSQVLQDAGAVLFTASLAPDSEGEENLRSTNAGGPGQAGASTSPETEGAQAEAARAGGAPDWSVPGVTGVRYGQILRVQITHALSHSLVGTWVHTA